MRVCEFIHKLCEAGGGANVKEPFRAQREWKTRPRFWGAILSQALRRWGLLLLLLAAGSARASPDLDGKLAAARAAIERILRDESDVAAETEKAEQAVRSAKAQAAAAAEEVRQASDALRVAEAVEAQAAARLARSESLLGERLRARYRLLRSGGGAAFVAADSPAALLRQRRALDRILDADLESLRVAQEDAASLARLRADREEVASRLNQRAAAAKAALQAAEATARERESLLASLRTERALQERSVVALTHAQARLFAELEKLAKEGAKSDATGFAALRGSLRRPVEGAVVEVLFGKMLNARFNTVVAQNGLDLRAAKGSEVVAVAPGKVIFADWFRAYGKLMILDHGGGYHTLYGHLDSIDREVGAEVAAGEAIGLLGDSGSLKGAYLYFEIREDGKPIDPLRWFR